MAIIYLSIFWIIGIWFASFLDVVLQFWLCATMLSLLTAAIFYKVNNHYFQSVAMLFMLCAGGSWYVISLPQYHDQQHISNQNDHPRTIILTGVVIDQPIAYDKVTTLHVAAEKITYASSNRTETVKGKVLVSAPHFPTVPYGARINVEGILKSPVDSRKGGYLDYLLRQEIKSSIYSHQVTIVERGQANIVKSALLKIRKQLTASIERIIPSPQSSLLNTIILGDRTHFPSALQDDFRDAGGSHLFAISGLHIAIVGGVIVGFCRLLIGRESKHSVIVTISLLGLYCVMVGGRPSVIRAVIMTAAYLIGQQWLHRPYISYAPVAIAAFIITLFNPIYLFDPGFQLSFTATIGIMLYTKPIEKIVIHHIFRGHTIKNNRFLSILLSLFSLSLAAQILVTPLLILHFEHLSLMSLITNILIIPMLPIVIILGMITAMAGIFFMPLGILLGYIEGGLLTLVIAIIQWIAALPFAAIEINFPRYFPIITLQAPVYSAAMIYLLFGLATWFFYSDNKIKQRWKGKLTTHRPQQGVSTIFTLLTLPLAMVIIFVGLSQPDGQLHIDFFDVGQGDATLITSPAGRQVLIDAGYYPSLIENHLGRVMPFWDRSLDMIVATHPDADHVTGIPGILERYHVDRLLVSTEKGDVSPYYDEVLSVAMENDVEMYRPAVGETIMLDDHLFLEVLHPGKSLDLKKRNNNSLSFRLVYHDFTVMLTGDAEEAAEQDIVKTGLSLASTILKVGHHGSNTSSLPTFLDKVQPQFAIVSAGQDNNFGHPHPRVMCRFHQRNIPVMDTRCHGSIRISTDGQTISWWSHQPDMDSTLSCNQPIDLAAICQSDRGITSR